jgi:hypothetical protein
MPPKKPSNSGLRSKNCRGFILLEVLVAMTMILGVWMVSVGVYRRLALNLTQQESKYSLLRKEWDAFEIQEHTRVNLNPLHKVLINEPARVPGRNRSMRTSTQSVIKDKR